MLFEELNRKAKSNDEMNFSPPFLTTIQANTLLVFGDDDPYFPVNIPVEMHTTIPNSYLWIIPYGGHLPVFNARKAEFTKQALAFLSGQWAD